MDVCGDEMSFTSMLTETITITTTTTASDGMGGFSTTTATVVTQACIENVGQNEIVAGGKITDMYTHRMWYSPGVTIASDALITDSGSVQYRIVPNNNIQKRGKVSNALLKQVMA
jgi:hypothetical protein